MPLIPVNLIRGAGLAGFLIMGTKNVLVGSRTSVLVPGVTLPAVVNHTGVCKDHLYIPIFPDLPLELPSAKP